MFVDPRVEEAVLETIAERDIDFADMEQVAQRLGRSRSRLYVQYGSWPKLLAYTHERVLGAIDTMFVGIPGDRRAQFDAWWRQLNEFLCRPYGVGFLRLRRRVTPGQPIEQFEVSKLPELVKWSGPRPSTVAPAEIAVAQALWLLAVSAARCPERSVDLRELAWSLTGAAAPSTKDELDFMPAALAEPL
ncbi:MAG: hypothetical protein JNK82_04295 [Myxococcaceae bacterium]|nr:hypothetical protein [Myxococcaceae bacterium]